MINLLLINGLNNRAEATILSTTQGVQFSYEGNLNLLQEINHPELRPTRVLVGCGNHQKLRFPVPGVIFNCVADPDDRDRSLAAVDTITGSSPAPVINRPDRIRATTRDNVAQLLAGIDGLVVPRTICVTPKRLRELPALLEAGGIGYPFLIRPAGRHGGYDLIRVDAATELDQLECFGYDGKRRYYVSEFVDFKNGDGRYRKARLVVVGEQLFARHLITAGDWNIHSRSRQEFMLHHAETLQEEQQFLTTFRDQLGPRSLAAVTQISRRLNLEYFGIDCSPQDDGSLVLFEANACVNVFYKNESDFAYGNATIETIREAMQQMIIARAGGGGV